MATMAACDKKLLLFSVAVLVMTVPTHGDVPSFCGGFMSFYFTDTSNPGMYKAHMTVMTGWVLGEGPCGPGCDASHVGQSTHDTRLAAIAAKGNPDTFGSWFKEMSIRGQLGPVQEDISVCLKNNDVIQGRVSAVSKTLGWEQEVADFEIDINTTFDTTKLSLTSYRSYRAWKMFDLNTDLSSHTANNNGTSDLKSFTLQTKITPAIRNDTGRPNSSPLVIFKPMYRILLNHATEIRLTTSDKEGDLVMCREAQNIEFDGLGPVPHFEISKDCIVTIHTMETDGYHHDGFGVIGVAIEDFNQHPIEMEGRKVEAFPRIPLSSSVLNVMIWVVANMTIPEFLPPTPQSQQVYEVYAGSQLLIPLVAKPSNLSTPDVRVVSFEVLSLPYHALSAQPPVPDPTRPNERVVTSFLEWRSSETDIGNFLIQVAAVDTDEYESMDRSYRIHVNEFRQEPGSKTDSNPYFPLFPVSGSITCQQDVTCSIPIFAKPGTDGHVISSIGLVQARTDLTHVEMYTRVEHVASYKGQTDLYRADVRFTAVDLGNKSVCFEAVDDHGLRAEKCVSVLLYLPDPCLTHECYPSATCVPSNDKLNFTCVCAHGRVGQLCDHMFDPCTDGPTIPCEPGGTCRSAQLPGHDDMIYFCRCDTANGYRAGPGSKSCLPPATTTPADPCSPNPCQHGGVCTPDSGGTGVTCACTPQIQGAHCENAVTTTPAPTTLPPDPCQAMECYQTATCVPTDDKLNFTCICGPGKVGRLCDQVTMFNPCTDGPTDPCGGPPGGECLARTVLGHTDMIYFCRCDTANGYRTGPGGKSCLPPVTTTPAPTTQPHSMYCDPNPCHSNGVCVSLVDTFQCRCVSSYTGDRCEHATPVVLAWSHDGLQADDSAFNVCDGNNVTLIWQVAAAGDKVVSAQWHYQTASSHKMIALLQEGLFVVLPPFSGRAHHLGGASLQLLGLTAVDSGTYSVEVVAGDLAAGRVGTLHGSVKLDVQGVHCGGCLPNPCGNGGVCRVELTSESGLFQCHCLPGFSGSTCQSALEAHCPPFDCTLDCGLVGYTVNVDGCMLCQCDQGVLVG